jgi:hypothetical protein
MCVVNQTCTMSHTKIEDRRFKHVVFSLYYPVVRYTHLNLPSAILIQHHKKISRKKESECSYTYIMGMFIRIYEGTYFLCAASISLFFVQYCFYNIMFNSRRRICVCFLISYFVHLKMFFTI